MGRDGTVYGVAVATGAILVFQIQPIAGKILLPAFGGGAAVWTACMFFFQAMLLAGYTYAFLLSRAPRRRAQAVIHAALLGISAAFLPARIALDRFDPSAGDPPLLILLILAVSIGFPFVMLASTAPLIQYWSSVTRPERPPWRLYALSNSGALLALVGYPLVVEPALPLAAQTAAWSAGYVLFLLVSFAACVRLWRHPPRSLHAAPPQGERVGHPALDAAFTLLLAGCGVALLLYVTSQLTQNIAPVPFLWILPLAVYLATYIISFSGARWYDRSIWGSLFVIAATALVVLHFFGSEFPPVPAISIWLLVLSCLCLVCHAELYRLRPSPARLAPWYVLIALGGAAGGAFVSVVAPRLFTLYWEGPLAAYLVFLAFGVLVLRGAAVKDGRGGRITDLQGRIDLWSRRLFGVGWVSGVLVFPAIVVILDALRPEYDVASRRNFYGVVNVRDVTEDGPPRRMLVDGTTIHGYQLLDERLRRLPTSYYGAGTGAELAVGLADRRNGLKAGIIGLGTGTLAAYGQPEDEFRFYEINPAVVELAKTYFTYLADSPARTEIVLGDARLSLARELASEGSGNYDLLVVDAFTSDAIPVHLLTLEAFQLYLAHLAQDGVLALHVTNTYLDLSPVVANLAAAVGRRAVQVTTVVDTGVSSRADWVLVLEERSLTIRQGVNGVQFTSVAVPSEERLWTDDYTNLLSTLRR